MSLIIKSLENFASEVKKLSKRYKNISDDLKCLKKELEANPKAGISLGGGCYKIRVPNSSVPTGKSDGFRVIYYFLKSDDIIYLMSIYSKSDLENIDEPRLQQTLRDNGLI